MRYLACLLSGLVVGVFADNAKSQSPTRDRLVAQFEAAAFGPADDTARRPRVLQRWEGSVDLIVSYEPADIRRLEPHLMSTLMIIRGHAGLKIQVENDPTFANFGVLAGRRARFADSADLIGLNSADCGHTHLVGHRSGPGVISSAHVAVVVNAETDGACMPAEAARALGLDLDACVYRPSAYCPPDRHQVTDADTLLLRVLYHPLLRPGMTRAEAMPIVRKIIDAMWEKTDEESTSDG